MWAPKYLRSSTTLTVEFMPFQVFWPSHLFTPRCVAKLKLFASATFAPHVVQGSVRGIEGLGEVPGHLPSGA